jgi:hypothetical protein
MRRLAALLLVLLTAGCATAGSRAGAVPTSSPTSSTPSRSASSPAPAGGTVTVDGVVQRGVEPGCLVLRAGTKSYLLVKGDGSTSATGVPVAVPVRVSGRVLTGIASYCQQGTPLAVTAVTRR